MRFGEKKTPEVIDPTMIAACGMNCAICSGFLRDSREKNVCPGCNGDDARKPQSTVRLLGSRTARSWRTPN